jgi:hypothetical protein
MSVDEAVVAVAETTVKNVPVIPNRVDSSTPFTVEEYFTVAFVGASVTPCVNGRICVLVRVPLAIAILARIPIGRPTTFTPVPIVKKSREELAASTTPALLFDIVIGEGVIPDCTVALTARPLYSAHVGPVAVGSTPSAAVMVKLNGRVLN